MPEPEIGEFVQLRGRTWLVEQGAALHDSGIASIRLSCVEDDAQGDSLDVIWDAEIAATILKDSAWEQIATNGSCPSAVPLQYADASRGHHQGPPSGTHA